MRACLALLAARAALAVTQPDGTVVPVDCVVTGSCPPSGCLEDVLACAGDPDLDIQVDATTEPDTFVPAGPITVTFLLQDAGSEAVFGWYNADPDAATPALYPIFPPCLGGYSAKGTALTVDWLSDANYAGGEVGLYLLVYGTCDSGCGGATCDVFYSEEWRNNDAGGGAAYVHLLKYASLAAGCRYYLGWEDLRTGGDNDFNDYVFQVDGVAGACGVGPDGEVGVCPAGSACEEGVCVPTSCEGGGGCPEGSTCGPCGTCIDVCEGVPCSEGEVCLSSMGGCVRECCLACAPPAEICDADCNCTDIGGESEAEAESEGEGGPDAGAAGFTADDSGCGCALGARP